MNLLLTECSNDSESTQSNTNLVENVINTDQTSVSSLPESSSADETENHNNISIQNITESKDTLVAIENNDLLLRKEKRNVDEEVIEKTKINNEEILEIIDFERGFEIEGELSSLHDNNINNVNSIIIKRKSDYVENNENKICNSQNFLPFKKRYIKKIARKKKLTASKNVSRTKRINRPVFETSPFGSQNLISGLDRPIEIEILSQAQVHEISSTQISPPHNDIHLLLQSEQSEGPSQEFENILNEQVNQAETVQANELEESEQEIASQEKYENLTVDLYYDSAFTDVELLAENIVKKQITEDLSRERKRKQFQPRKQHEKVITTESSSTASSSSSISSSCSFNNLDISNHRNNKNKNSRKKNLKTDINNVQGEQFFRSQAGINENTDDEFRTGLAEIIKNESNTCKKLFRTLLEKKKEGISQANEAIDQINEKNEIKKVKMKELYTKVFELKSQKRKIESKCVIMDSEVTSCEMEEENNNTKSEAIIQCKNISSSNLSEEEIENILGNSRDSENCFDNNNNSDRNDENILKSEARTRKLKVRINKNLSKLIQNNKEEKKSKKIECKQKDKNESKEQNAKFEETSKKKKQDNTGKKETKKFFHHSEKPSLNARKKDNENLQIKEKRYSNIKKSSRKPLSVFDFSASQSSPSNSDDPTKDVINELVKKGKAQVVKYVKGSGKLKTKFRNPRPSKKQISKVESEPISAIPVSETRNMVKEVHFNINESIDSNFDDHHIDTASIPEVNKSNINSFSGLARQAIQNRVTQSPYSTLMSNPRQIKDKNVLLALARSFIRRSEEMNKNKNISTKMNMPSNVKKLNASNQSGSASPWRVEEDLPSLFYFSRNSDNLPSASSDILYPPSPTRNKRKTSRISNKNLSLTKSLNNSNIENIQPSFEEPKLMIETNPKKGNPRRSPLKQIEIIDVINLPFMAKNNSTPIQKPAVFNPFSPLQIQTQKILFNESANDLENQTEEAEITNLFGFDQDIEEESMDNNDSAKLNTKISKNNLHHKLKKLKRLVPYKRPKQDQQGPTRLNIKKIRPIFEDTIETFHQPKIREMLCSTKNKSKENNEENEDSSNIVSSSDENGNENSREHYDLEPVLFETPTEANKSVRTYRPKRKRTKLRNHFVLFHDSDEESDVELPKKKMKHHKNETNEKELTSFYQEFNTMCDEVDKYELVIQ